MENRKNRKMIFFPWNSKFELNACEGTMKLSTLLQCHTRRASSIHFSSIWSIIYLFYCFFFFLLQIKWTEFNWRSAIFAISIYNFEIQSVENSIKNSQFRIVNNRKITNGRVVELIHIEMLLHSLKSIKIDGQFSITITKLCANASHPMEKITFISRVRVHNSYFHVN